MFTAAGCICPEYAPVALKVFLFHLFKGLSKKGGIHVKNVYNYRWRMWFLDSFYKYTVAVILILTIVLLLYHTAPVFYPIMWFITAILLPVLFAALLFYIVRPMVDFLERWRIPRPIAILMVYFIMAIFGAVVCLHVVPRIVEQVGRISDISPDKIEAFKSNTHDIVGELKDFLSSNQLPELENVFFGYLQKVNTIVYQMAYNTISTLASIAIALALTPFVLYYFLRDAKLFPKFILRFTPLSYHEEIDKVLHDIDRTLSNFILAQLTVAGIVGFFLLCGYSLIGLPEALTLALFAMIFYVIPILGTFIAIIPAIIVGLTISYVLVLKVILVMFLAHFIETNLLTPRLMSQRLQIHPLTVILLLLAAGSLYGLLGLLLVTPTYAILKVIIWNIYKISRLHYETAKINDEAAKRL